MRAVAILAACVAGWALLSILFWVLVVAVVF